MYGGLQENEGFLERKILTNNKITIGFTLSQATKALRESISIVLLYFRPMH